MMMMMVMMMMIAVDDNVDDDGYDDANGDDDGDDDDDNDVYADNESTRSVIRDGSIGAAQGILSSSTVKFPSSCDCCCDTSVLHKLYTHRACRVVLLKQQSFLCRMVGMHVQYLRH
jgi:hypothetical protein